MNLFLQWFSKLNHPEKLDIILSGFFLVMSDLFFSQNITKIRRLTPTISLKMLIPYIAVTIANKPYHREHSNRSEVTNNAKCSGDLALHSQSVQDKVENKDLVPANSGRRLTWLLIETNCLHLPFWMPLMFFHLQQTKLSS